MPYASDYGAFVARSELTVATARRLAGAGLSVVMLQVEWQRSRLPQRTAQQLLREHWAAHAAGLEVWWWGWTTPTQPAERGRRPSGARALEQRLDELVVELGTPAGFIVDAEVGGGWSARRLPELPDHAAAARAAGMPSVGLTSHGRIGPAWQAHAFTVGLPQLYGDQVLDVGFTRRCLATWDDAPMIWPVLGCADPASTPAQMRGDLATLGALDVTPRPGALWWTARQLTGERLEAAVP